MQKVQDVYHHACYSAKKSYNRNRLNLDAINNIMRLKYELVERNKREKEQNIESDEDENREITNVEVISEEDDDESEEGSPDY